jgi:hypothetical protein
MPDMQWILEIVLMALLGATLFHAVRLERALGVLKRDRAVLEELVGGFNTSMRQAEAGTDRLRAAADGAGRQLAQQIDTATALKEDLVLLSQRGEHLADRLGDQVRGARPVLAEVETNDAPRQRSQAERDLLKALRMNR